MRTTFYSDFTLNKLEFQQVRSFYVEWVLGVMRFEKYRESRARVGVNPHWPMKSIHEGVNLDGQNDARLASRYSDGHFVLRLVHRDAGTPTILWRTAVDIQESEEGCRIRQGVARSAPPGVLLEPLAAAPAVIPRLLDWNGNNLKPRGLGNASVLSIGADEADDFVHHVLLDQSRVIPHVLVTPRQEDGYTIVTPRKLAKLLAGMARVVHCASSESAEEIGVSLRRRDFAQEFGTSGGGVRLFMSRLSKEDNPFDHRLWTRPRLDSYGDTVDDRVAGEIGERLVRGTIARGFFSCIEQFDQTATRRRASELLAKAEKAQSEQEKSDLEIQALRGEVAALEDELARSDSERAEMEEKLAEEIERGEHSDQETDDQCQEVYRLKAKSQALQDALSKQGAGEAGLTASTQAALRSVIGSESPTPKHCLLAAKVVYANAVEVLPSSLSSAASSQSFIYGTKLWESLKTLLGDYRTQLLAGGSGDAVAKKLFGKKCFAAKESKTTMSNVKAREVRTFYCGGEKYVMWRHLKIGVKDCVEESIRLHFDWDAKKKAIIIGHCGGHLYLPGHS